MTRTAAALISLLFAIGCSNVPQRQEIAQSIDRALQGGARRINLAGLADFEWDEVCVANPFAQGPVISQQLGFRWRGRGSGVGDEKQLVIFVAEREPRSRSKATGQLHVRGDKWMVEATGCIPRDSAIFIVEKRGGVQADVYALVPLGGATRAAAIAENNQLGLPSGEPQRASILFPLDSFPQLPVAVRKSLSDAGCLIPQTYVPKTPNNVISGQFAAAGQIDWAVLCSRRDTSSIVVVWGGAARCPTPFRPVADAAHGAPATYDRFIGPASMDYILQHKEWYDGPEPPARDHEGIHDGYAEKASTIFFCHQGKWYELQGAD